MARSGGLIEGITFENGESGMLYESIAVSSWFIGKVFKDNLDLRSVFTDGVLGLLLRVEA
jgi:hypothetical protein